MDRTALRRTRWAAIGMAAMMAATAWAQQPVAKLKGVNGSVLVSGQAGLASGAEAQPLANGTRVITTANSRVVVVFDKGCEVRLEENQRLDIDSGKPCAAMLPVALGTAVPAAGSSLAGLVIPALGGVAIAADVIGNRGGGNPPAPVSPN